MAWKDDVVFGAVTLAVLGLGDRPQRVTAFDGMGNAICGAAVHGLDVVLDRLHALRVAERDGDLFSACSVDAAVPDTFTLSPSTSILTPEASRPCLSSFFLSSSPGAALASLPPKIDAPTFLTKLISPIVVLPLPATGSR